MMAIVLAVGIVVAIYTPSALAGTPGVLYAERCGGTFDGMALTPPLVEVVLTQQSISIRYLSSTLEIPYSAVRSTRIDRHVLLRGVWIAHDLATPPTEIILFSRHNDKLRAIIDEQARLVAAR
ncbi:MAG TPA: hypothetical protein VGJ81_13775 [Thermoanaerobaculia bacterium]|jgi:hypothetical protein